jgi:hypothetical protein
MGRIAMLPLLVLLSVRLSTTAASARQSGTYLPNRTDTRAAFRGGKTLHFPDGLAITLLTYRPVTGLSAFPGGPPLRPRKGYQFVTTIWLAQNTTKHEVTVGSWVARSRGMSSRGFSTGNGVEIGLIMPRAKMQYYWLFEVARVGRVGIFYGAFRVHWLPRG